MHLLRHKAADRGTASDSQTNESGRPEVPDRYTIREKDGKQELVCRESPSLVVRIQRGLSIPGPAARKSAPGSIYLDGAAQESPFLDVERQVYNLDHHQGCVRSFTLATCEQAMVLVRKGLDLHGRDWTIYAIEPDLDTVLAIWVLLNHIHINDSMGEVRSRIMPIVRLQGVIDAHGLEMQELSGYPETFRVKIYSEIEQLRAREVEIRKEGKWEEVDFLAYTADALHAVDLLVYSSRHFEDVLDVEELARAEIGNHNLVVVCRSDEGIYDVEQYLRRIHGKRLSIIILQKDSRTYTLRLTDAFLPGTLQSVYERLNLVDPAAGSRRSGNRWGGAAEIGGSPRSTGTDLTPGQIVEACTVAFRKPSSARRIRTVVTSILGSSFAMLGPIIALYLLNISIDRGVPLTDEILHRIGLFTLCFCVLAIFLLLVVARPFPKLYGLSLFCSWDWLFLAPTALLGGALGGTWGYVAVLSSHSSFLDHSWKGIVVALALPAAAEVLFRGYILGTLAGNFRTQKSGSSWRLTWPTIISSLLYALWSLVPWMPVYTVALPLRVAATSLFGLSAAIARERSESILPPILLHWSAIILMFFLSSFFGDMSV